MSFKLYELSNRYLQILNSLEDMDNLPDEVKIELDSIEESSEEKIKNYVKIIKILGHEINVIEEEYKKLAKKKKSLEKKIEYLKDRVLESMEIMGKSKIENKPYFNVNLKQGQWKVDVRPEDEEKIPVDYKKISVTLDRMKMREEMLEGVVIPGAKLIQEKYVEIR